MQILYIYTRLRLEGAHSHNHLSPLMSALWRLATARACCTASFVGVGVVSAGVRRNSLAFSSRARGHRREAARGSPTAQPRSRPRRLHGESKRWASVRRWDLEAVEDNPDQVVV